MVINAGDFKHIMAIILTMWLSEWLWSKFYSFVPDATCKQSSLRWELEKSIECAVSLIGGVDNLVERGDTILLKPNYNTSDPSPGSSDPEFIKAIGIRVSGKNGWQVLFDRSGWRHVKVNRGQYLRRVSVAKEVFEIKKIVYAPLMKTHHAAEYTGAIKLSRVFVKPFFD